MGARKKRIGTEKTEAKNGPEWTEDDIVALINEVYSRDYVYGGRIVGGTATIVRDTARDTFYNRLASLDDASLARALTSSRQNRDLLEFLAVSPDAAAQAALRIKAERQLQEFSRNVNPNLGSRTERTRAAAGGGVDQLARAEQTAEFVSGGTASRLMTILNMAQGRLRGLTPAVREDMARMLTEIDPQQQRAILQRLSAEDRKLLQEDAARRLKRFESVQFGGRLPGLLSTEER